MATTVRAQLHLNQGQIERMLRGRDGAVGRIMAGFAGLSTVRCKEVAGERIRHQTREYVNSIRSTTEQTAQGTAVVTSASARHSAALEVGAGPHVIYPTSLQVLRFNTSGGGVQYATHVDHPGNKPYNILRDGVTRAGRQLNRIARI
jgi:hypothetical protein